MKDTESAIVLLRAMRAVLSKEKELRTRNVIRTPEAPETNLSVFPRAPIHNGISRFHLGAELSC